MLPRQLVNGDGQSDAPNQPLKVQPMNTFDDQHDDQHEDGGSPNEPHDASHQPVHQNVLTEDILSAIDARLEKLPRRQKLTVEAAIKRLSPRIRNLLAKGYTNAEVVTELNKELGAFDITVSVRTLTRYMPPKATKKAAKSAANTNRGG